MSKQTKDRHVAEAAVLVRMSAAERKEIEAAVKILNDRMRPEGGKVYLGSFMLQAALGTARKVIEGHVPHVTGKRST